MADIRKQIEELLEAQRKEAREKAFGEAIAVAKSCFDVSGGHRAHPDRLKIFRDGMQTVINAIEGLSTGTSPDFMRRVAETMMRQEFQPLTEGEPLSQGEVGYRHGSEDICAVRVGGRIWLQRSNGEKYASLPCPVTLEELQNAADLIAAGLYAAREQHGRETRPFLKKITEYREGRIRAVLTDDGVLIEALDSEPQYAVLPSQCNREDIVKGVVKAVRNALLEGRRQGEAAQLKDQPEGRSVGRNAGDEIYHHRESNAVALQGDKHVVVCSQRRDGTFYGNLPKDATIEECQRACELVYAGMAEGKRAAASPPRPLRREGEVIASSEAGGVQAIQAEDRVMLRDARTTRIYGALDRDADTEACQRTVDAVVAAKDAEYRRGHRAAAGTINAAWRSFVQTING